MLRKESDEEGRWAQLRANFWGDRDRIGWWTVPVFVAIGLMGAVLSGAIAVVYYGQQIDRLRDETAQSRADLQDAVDLVQQAGQDALAAIAQEVEDVRAELSRDLPVEDVSDAGVVLIRNLTPAPPPPSSAPPPGQTDEELAAQTAEPQPTAEPTRPPLSVQVGAGFAVVRDGTDTFFVTTFDVVRKPGTTDEAVVNVDVITRSGEVVGRVHSWDVDLDLALVVAPAGNVTVPPWRPVDEPIGPGDRIYAIGMTPTGGTVTQEGALASVEPRAILTDLAPLDFVRGGPLVDLDGQVIAVVTGALGSFGATQSASPAVPIRVLCERLLRCGPGEAAA